MPEVTMLFAAALGLFLVIAILLIALFHRPARQRRAADGLALTDAGPAAPVVAKPAPDSGGWWSGGEASGGDGGGGGGGDGGGD